jgi:fibronectin-binding autotransporter adhesin
MLKFHAGVVAVTLFLGALPTAQAQLYWDINGTNANSSDSGDATGIWNASNTFWSPNTSTNGTDPTGVWVADSAAVFSTGGSSGYTVHLADPESASGITFNDDQVTIDSTGGTLTLSGATPTISSPGSTIDTISAPIAGLNGLTYTGGNALTTLNLSGANSYTGGTTVNGGTLALGASNVIPDDSILQMTTVAAVASTFKMNDNSDTIKAIGHLTTDAGGTGGQGTIAIGNGTLTIQDNGENRTWFGVLTSSSNGKFIKNGDGKLIINATSASNIFSGELVINNGTYEQTNTNSFGTTPNKLTMNGGTIHRAGGTLAWQKFDVGGNFTVDLGGNTTDFQINGSDTAIVNTLKANAQITVLPVTGTNLNVGSWLWRGAIGDGGNGYGITKLGDGVMRISSDSNTYTGQTTIKQGVLTLTSPSTSPSPAPARLGDGTGRVNLSWNGTGVPAELAFNGPTTTLYTGERKVVVDNPVNITASGVIGFMPANSFGGPGTGTALYDFVFTNNNFTLDADNTGACPVSSSCTLTFRNDVNSGTAANANNAVFRPTMQGNFTYGGDVVISNFTGVIQGIAANTSRVTQLVSSNTGTQTWSGNISGNGAFRRGATGTTAFTGDVSLLYAGTSTNLTGAKTFTIDSGGTLSIGSGGSTGAITSAADIADNGHLVFNRTGVSSYSGVITGTGDLTKSGSGALTLSGVGSNITGAAGAAVNGGSLLVTGSLASSGGVTVASSATLGGTGTVTGAITNNGTIAPGTSVGTLSVTGNVTNGANSHWAIELSGASADKLAVTGNIDLSAVDFLDVTGAGTGSSWIIGTYTGTETGVFNTITSGYTVTYTGGNITLNGASSCAPGDLNCDGHVDASDYVFWRKNGGLPAPDYNTWRAHFGSPPGAGSGGGLSGGGAVPEPGALSLLICALGSLVTSSRALRSRRPS